MLATHAGSSDLILSLNKFNAPLNTGLVVFPYESPVCALPSCASQVTIADCVPKVALDIATALGDAWKWYSEARCDQQLQRCFKKMSNPKTHICVDLAGEILGEYVGQAIVSIALEACADARSQPGLGDSCRWKNVEKEPSTIEAVYLSPERKTTDKVIESDTKMSTSPPAGLFSMSDSDRMKTKRLALQARANGECTAALINGPCQCQKCDPSFKEAHMPVATAGKPTRQWQQQKSFKEKTFQAPTSSTTSNFQLTQ